MGNPTDVSVAIAYILALIRCLVDAGSAVDDETIIQLIL